MEELLKDYKEFKHERKWPGGRYRLAKLGVTGLDSAFCSILCAIIIYYSFQYDFKGLGYKSVVDVCKNI